LYRSRSAREDARSGALATICATSSWVFAGVGYRSNAFFLPRPLHHRLVLLVDWIGVGEQELDVSVRTTAILWRAATFA
jgi:hypothetical protein